MSYILIEFYFIEIILKYISLLVELIKPVDGI